MFFHVDQTSLSERSEAMAMSSEMAGSWGLTPANNHDPGMVVVFEGVS